MSQAMTLRPEVVPPRLDQLAASIIGHHQATQEYVRKTLEHALACGEALTEARGLVQEGQWRAWLRENVAMDKCTAGMYMRLAAFRQELSMAGIDGIQAARDYVQRHGLMIDYGGPSRRLSDDALMELRLLSQSGLSQREISKRIGIGQTTVGKILRGERYKSTPTPRLTTGQRPPKPAPRPVEITDAMIEGMARWLAVRGGVELTDKTRAQATEALRVALNYKRAT